MVSNVTAYTVSSAATRAKSTSHTYLVTNKPSAPGGQADITAQEGISLSVTSRQLAQSAIAADKRDASMTRSELADEAKRLRNQFSGSGYNRELAAQEVPDTENPALLARAKQATAFVQSRQAHRGHSTVENPFHNLSYEQLTLIMYDDSGRFTKNERHVAWLEQYDRREEWAEKVVAQAHREYQATGQNDHFYQACIDHYNGLPRIERVQFPVDYVPRLKYWIANNKPAEKSSYLEILLGQFDGNG
ncbi:hypothetical protein [Salinisphaera sp.]|uniref:hypothetical protein n=1 Tax=Salinisphaera sp. TaxID=1914330 RepID=UPI002D77BFE9|nr:hypothetical protein [Salinisphaera sp.]HET7315398.1 hypothetical protein [Salinisphaera sp.]